MNNEEWIRLKQISKIEKYENEHPAKFTTGLGNIAQYWQEQFWKWTGMIPLILPTNDKKHCPFKWYKEMAMHLWPARKRISSLAEIFNKQPEYIRGIGIIMNGMDVIDVDCDTVESFQIITNLFPNTFLYTSGKGGHCFLHVKDIPVPAGREHRNTECPPFDFIAGGLSILPGSWHTKRKCFYVPYTEVPDKLTEIKMEELIKIVNTLRKMHGSSTYIPVEINKPRTYNINVSNVQNVIGLKLSEKMKEKFDTFIKDKVVPGTRHKFLLKIQGTMIVNGYNDNDILIVCKAFTKYHNDDGKYNFEEIRRCLQDSHNCKFPTILTEADLNE